MSGLCILRIDSRDFPPRTSCEVPVPHTRTMSLFHRIPNEASETIFPCMIFLSTALLTGTSLSIFFQFHFFISMPPLPGTQWAQPSTSNLRLQFQSPKCPHNKYYTQRVIKVPGQAAWHQAHVEHLDQLLNKTRWPTPPPQLIILSNSTTKVYNPGLIELEVYSFQSLNNDYYSHDMVIDSENHPTPPSQPMTSTQ